jgi:histidyl-tRNA synthetase
VNRLAAPRGTQDILPKTAPAWSRLEGEARRIAGSFGYGEIRTPSFEMTELFVRGVGDTSDIVEKEMYSVVAGKGDREDLRENLTLRPEWTAPVVRAALQHALFDRGPLRLFYVGSIFRHEKPQKGRFREAHQFGIECFGYSGPEADAEVISIAVALIRTYALSGVTVRLNSVGDEHCRPLYRQALLDHFTPHLSSLSEDSQRRLQRNPLRILDSKSSADAPFIATAPTLLDYLCADCRRHFDDVQRYLGSLDIEYVVDPKIVRGLDYYTRTVFEITSTALGAQSTVCGGGRYDGLVESLGGKAIPAVGFGLGLERFLMMVEAAGTGAVAPRSGIQAIALGAEARARLIPLVYALRQYPGITVHMDFRERKLFDHFKTADVNAAKWALIFGENELAQGEIVLRDLEQRSERRIGLDGAVRSIWQLIGEGDSDAR